MARQELSVGIHRVFAEVGLALSSEHIIVDAEPPGELARHQDGGARGEVLAGSAAHVKVVLKNFKINCALPESAQNLHNYDEPFMRDFCEVRHVNLEHFNFPAFWYYPYSRAAWSKGLRVYRTMLGRGIAGKLKALFAKH